MGRDGRIRVLPLHCDFNVAGGWTKVAEMHGSEFTNWHSWLNRFVNVTDLASGPLQTNRGHYHYASIDAIDMAVNHATKVRMSSAGGTKWVEWAMPRQRTTETWWNALAANKDTVYRGWQNVGRWQVDVHASGFAGGRGQRCWQNRFGVMKYPEHGGSFPAVTLNWQGNTRPGDNCMAISVCRRNERCNGWTQNGNGGDFPNSDNDWPNRHCKDLAIVYPGLFLLATPLHDLSLGRVARWLTRATALKLIYFVSHA